MLMVVLMSVTGCVKDGNGVNGSVNDDSSVNN